MPHCVKNPRESLSLGDTVLEFKKHVDEALTGTHFSGHDGDGLVVGLDDQNRKHSCIFFLLFARLRLANESKCIQLFAMT